MNDPRSVDPSEVAPSVGPLRRLLSDRWPGSMLPRRRFDDGGSGSDLADLIGHLREMSAGDDPRSVLAGLRSLGVFAAVVPAAPGGLGLRRAEVCRLLGVIAAHLGGRARHALENELDAIALVVRHGSSDQQRTCLPRVDRSDRALVFAPLRGDRGDGDAPEALRADLEADGRVFRLDGRVAVRGEADLASEDVRRHRTFVVEARSPMAAGSREDTSLFLVEVEAANEQWIREARLPDGRVRLRCDKLRVAEDGWLGPVGAGRSMIEGLTAGRRLHRCALDLGAMPWDAWEDRATGIASAATRQAVLAELAIGRYFLDGVLYATAAAADDGADVGAETAVTRLLIVETHWRLRQLVSEGTVGAPANGAEGDTVAGETGADLRQEIAFTLLRSAHAASPFLDARNAGPLAVLGRVVVQWSRRTWRFLGSSARLDVDARLKREATFLGSMTDWVSGVTHRIASRFGASIDNALSPWMIRRVADTNAAVYALWAVLGRINSRLAHDPWSEAVEHELRMVGVLARRLYDRVRLELAAVDDNVDDALSDIGRLASDDARTAAVDGTTPDVSPIARSHGDVG